MAITHGVFHFFFNCASSSCSWYPDPMDWLFINTTSKKFLCSLIILIWKIDLIELNIIFHWISWMFQSSKSCYNLSSHFGLHHFLFTDKPMWIWLSSLTYWWHLYCQSSTSTGSCHRYIVSEYWLLSKLRIIFFLISNFTAAKQYHSSILSSLKSS